MRHLPIDRVCQPREIVLAIAAAMAACGTPAVFAQATAPAAAQAATANYDLPVAPMAETLAAIARISGQAVHYDPAAVAGMRSSAVRGVLSARDAVTVALAGSSLSASYQQGVLTVAMADQQTVTVLAHRAKAETSFKADLSDTATRSGTDLMDTPGGVTIITSDVLQSQQTTNLLDALRNVSGVGFTQSPQGVNQFSIRGFNQTASTVNGISDRNAAGTNVFGVESIEVLKGPQAILAGGDSLGGGVNIVMKKPTSDIVRDFTGQLGTGFNLTLAGDVSGPVSADDKRLTYRFIASAAHQDHAQLDYNGRQDYYAMPELRWKDATTDFTIGISYEKSHQALPEYTFARRDGVILPAPAMQLSNPADGFDLLERKAWASLDQKLTNWLTFISRVQYTGDNQLLHLWSPNGLSYLKGAPNNSPKPTMTFYPTEGTTRSDQLSTDNYLRAVFNLGGVENKLSVGVGTDNYQYREPQYTGASLSVGVYPAVPVAFPTPFARDAGVLSDISSGDSRQLSGYVQDLISYKDLSVLLNYRQTNYELDSNVFFAPSTNFATPGKLIRGRTPGVGAVYRVTPDASVYASWSNGFVPQTNAACGGGIVPPIESRNKEVGAKFQFLDNALSVTAAAFQIDQDNSLIYDPVNRCQNVRPAEQTKGFEVDVQGQIAKGWSTIFNYTNERARDVGVNTTIYPGIPRNKASLWTVYSLPFEQVKGLGVGLGVSSQGSQQGTYVATYPFTVPSQTQIDTSLFYDQPKLHLTLGVKNVFDRRLYGISTTNSYIPILPGRTVMLTVRTSFD